MSDALEQGFKAMSRGAYAEALALFDSALAEDPNDAEAYYNRGAALHSLERYDESIASYDAALNLAPGNEDILHNRANALMARGMDHVIAGRYGPALADFEAILVHDPLDVAARLQRASALMGLERLDESAVAFQAALAEDASVPGAWYGLSVVLFQIGRHDEALAALDKFRACAPESADPLYAKGVRLLSLGRYAEGWPLYEHRWDAPVARMAPPRDNDELRWNGSRIEGLLRVWAEQGPGDQILFSRFLADALTQTPRVAYACASRFEALMRRSFPKLERVAAEQAFAPGEAVAQAPLASLAAMFADAPISGGPYLQADAERVALLRGRYKEIAQGRPIIGVAWSSKNAISGAQKSVPLSRWRTLLSAPCLFVDLQYGDTTADVREAEAAFGCTIHRDASIDQLADFDAFAAQVAALDAVVSVSNTTVHMAGALGVPCFVMPPPAGGLHWYWGLEGERTPWYDSVRLIRRARSENWETQIERAAARLAEFLETRAL